VGADCRQDVWPADWQHCPPAQLVDLPFQQRYDLAVLQASGELDTLAVTQGLTRLRDLLARRVLVVVTEPALTDIPTQLRALGFSQLVDVQADQPWQIWQFNILAYKQVPDWLNAKFWANPENFHKYRW
ncbi:MAG: DUF6231 family protein, partial [Flavobacteriales bacterium]